MLHTNVLLAYDIQNTQGNAVYSEKLDKFEGILPKGPYLPCVSMSGRALLAGYPRVHWVLCPRVRLGRAYLVYIHLPLWRHGDTRIVASTRTWRHRRTPRVIVGTLLERWYAFGALVVKIEGIDVELGTIGDRGCCQLLDRCVSISSCLLSDHVMILMIYSWLPPISFILQTLLQIWLYNCYSHFTIVWKSSQKLSRTVQFVTDSSLLRTSSCKYYCQH